MQFLPVVWRLGYCTLLALSASMSVLTAQTLDMRNTEPAFNSTWDSFKPSSGSPEYEQIRKAISYLAFVGLHSGDHMMLGCAKLLEFKLAAGQINVAKNTDILGEGATEPNEVLRDEQGQLVLVHYSGDWNNEIIINKKALEKVTGRGAEGNKFNTAHLAGTLYHESIHCLSSEVATTAGRKANRYYVEHAWMYKEGIKFWSEIARIFQEEDPKWSVWLQSRVTRAKWHNEQQYEHNVNANK